MAETAEFWSAIANDGSRPVEERRLAVFELFRQHVRPGMTVGDLAAVLDHPTWFTDEDVSILTGLGGKIPVSWEIGDTIFVLDVFRGLEDSRDGHWAIYIRVAGRIGVDEFRRALRGEQTPREVSDAELREIGLSPADAGRL